MHNVASYIYWLNVAAADSKLFQTCYPYKCNCTITIMLFLQSLKRMSRISAYDHDMKETLLRHNQDGYMAVCKFQSIKHY